MPRAIDGSPAVERPASLSASLPVGVSLLSIGLDAFGLACYIAWSYVFWDSPLLLEGPLSHGRAHSPAGMFLLVQGVFTAVAALALMLCWGRVAPLRRNRPVLGLFTLMEVAAVALAALGQAGWGATCAAVGFAMSGAGSAVRLGWEERMSVRGVQATAARAAVGYIVAVMLYCGIVALPDLAALAVTGALPLVSLALLVYQERRRPNDGLVLPDPAIEPLPLSASFRACFERVPWRIPVFVALSYFCFGATRMGSLNSSLQEATASSSLVVVLGMLACCTGVALAYVSYRKSVQVGICLAVPIMAAASLFNLAGAPQAGDAMFYVANVGVEITKYLMLFLMIDVIIKDGAPALLCLALLRFAQWGGSALGQATADALPSDAGIVVAMLLVLVVALLLMMGAFPGGLGVRGIGRFAGAPGDAGGAGRSGGLAVGWGRATVASGPAVSGGFPSRTAGALAESPGAPLGEAAGAAGSVVGPATALGRTAASGGPVLAASVARAAERYGLSPRETEVLGIWATGRSAAYVEKALFISQNTVKTHLNHIYGKTGAANRGELLELLDGIAAEPDIEVP